MKKIVAGGWKVWVGRKGMAEDEKVTDTRWRKRNERKRKRGNTMEYSVGLVGTR